MAKVIELTDELEKILKEKEIKYETKELEEKEEIEEKVDKVEDKLDEKIVKLLAEKDLIIKQYSDLIQVKNNEEQNNKTKFESAYLKNLREAHKK